MSPSDWERHPLTDVAQKEEKGKCRMVMAMMMGARQEGRKLSHDSVTQQEAAFFLSYPTKILYLFFIALFPLINIFFHLFLALYSCCNSLSDGHLVYNHIHWPTDSTLMKMKTENVLKGNILMQKQMCTDK